MNHRIIGRLDIKGPNLVKGIHLEGLRALGTPWDFAKHYYDNGIDELIFQDVVASLYQRNSLDDIISRTANEIFIPITVGGGIRTLDDIKRILRSGADKVSLNTAVINNPNLIKEASETFGSSTIVVCVECIRNEENTYLAYTDNGREFTGVRVIDWVKKIEELGAGEILLTSVDRDGTGIGYDIDLISCVTQIVSIPVIAHGGPSKLIHIGDALLNGKCDAVALASILHYGDFLNHKGDLDINMSEGNFEFISRKKVYKNFEKIDIQTIKNSLIEQNITVRV